MATVYYSVKFAFRMGPQGWTELYYWGMDSGTQRQLVNDSAALAIARRGLMGNTAFLDSISWALLDAVSGKPNKTNPAHDVTFALGLGCGPGIAGPSTPADDPWLAMLVELKDAAWQVRRMLLMRGGGAGMINYNPAAPLAGGIRAQYKVLMDAWLAQLGASGLVAVPGTGPWQLRGQDRTNPSVFISEVTVANNGHWIVNLNTALPALKGTKVRVSDVKGCGTDGINGLQTIIETTGTSLTLSGVQCCPCTITYLGGGSVKTLPTRFVPIGFGQYERTVKRSTGQDRWSTKGRRRRLGCCKKS